MFFLLLCMDFTKQKSYIISIISQKGKSRVKIMLYQGFDDDREYLINKFRNPVMDPLTGLTNDEITAKLPAVAESWKGQSVFIAKGHGVEFICKNMQIDVISRN